MLLRNYPDGIRVSFDDHRLVANAIAQDFPGRAIAFGFCG